MDVSKRTGTRRPAETSRHLAEIRLTWAMTAVTLLAAFLFAWEALPPLMLAFRETAPGLVIAHGIFLAVVAFLIYGNLVYQLARIGYYRRLAAHRPATPEELDAFAGAAAPPSLAIL